MNETPPPPPPKRIAELIQTIKESADKLADDKTSRGDLKIISRTLRELRYAFKVFSPYRHSRKVTVFGSARTTPDQPAYQQAVAFGRAMAAHDWFVVTGAASGIMEAGHAGAGREHSMGLNILLPFEQSTNPIITGDRKLVYMKYFFTRKLMFVKESDAFCLMPGGFGTLDEGLEVLTLLQTGKHDMMPVVLLDEPGGSYWTAFDQFVRDQLLDRGMIGPEDLSLYRLTDRVEDAVEEILRFYSVYHSMRYVRTNLVFRLQRPPSESLLEEINDRFQDILLRGPVRRERAVARGTRGIRSGGFASAGVSLRPPQFRPAAAVDRLHQSQSGRRVRRRIRDSGIRDSQEPARVADTQPLAVSQMPSSSQATSHSDVLRLASIPSEQRRHAGGGRSAAAAANLPGGLCGGAAGGLRPRRCSWK